MDWETTDDVNAMLEAVRGSASERKLLLFACGCCRLSESQVPAVGALADRFERQSDKPLSRDDRWSMLSVVGSAMLGDIAPMIERLLSGGENDPWSLAKNVAWLQRWMADAYRQDGEPLPEGIELSVRRPPLRTSKAQAEVLREIVANPIASTPFDPRWRTETVRGLAAAIDADGAWDRLPILADALQDAGCEDFGLLDHCRAENHVHRRGCWALDRVLERP